ncbi:MAG: hypothetical protein IPK26_03615 [Planctomycetes bacterium]|nr:hypothetical protein [Planctomycetota bacterium]
MNRGPMFFVVVSMAASAAAQTQLSWRPHRGVQAQFVPTLAWDEVRDRVVMPGITGRGGAAFEWDGTTWFERQGIGPSFEPRGQPASCYDSRRRATFVFGAGIANDESWAWDGLVWQRQQLAQSPPGRVMHRLCFDAALGEVVLLGGLSLIGAGAILDDCWTWNGVRWQPVAGTLPPPRHGHAMAFDRARSETIVFGGYGDTTRGPLFLADTWAFAGGVWRQVASTGPSGRYGAAAAFDRGTGTIALFGGQNAFTLADTWEWNGTNWRRIATTSTPGPRLDAAMVESPTGRPIMFGGSDHDFPRSDLWQRDGTGWTRLHDDLAPAHRTYTAMAYDLARNSAVLFGGRLTDVPLGDTWLRSSGRWQKQAPANSPSRRAFLAMAYDIGRARTVLFGGLGVGPLDDTWEWNGVDWRSIATPVRPSARELHAMCWDPLTGTVLLFGGQSLGETLLGDTWLFDGNTWRDVPGPGPSPRVGASLATDLPRLQPLMFGGATEVNGTRAVVDDTWRWTGAAWGLARPLAAPAARAFASLAYDWRNGELLLHGGTTLGRNGMGFADSWTWDGAIWSPVVLAGAPAIALQPMVYHVADQQFLTGFGMNGQLFLPEPMVVSTGPAAATARYGTACGSAPELLADDAVPGRRLALEMRGAPPAAPALFLWSIARANVPIGGGCALQVALPAVSQLAIANAGGVAFAATDLAAIPALRGAVLTAQAAVIDGGSGPFGVAVSRGVECRIGD